MLSGRLSAAKVAAPVTLAMPSRRVKDCPEFDPKRVGKGIVSGMDQFSKGRGGKGRHPRRSPGGGHGYGSDGGAAGEFDLVAILTRGFGTIEKNGGGTGEKFRVRGLPYHDRLGGGNTPGPRGDAT